MVMKAKNTIWYCLGLFLFFVAPVPAQTPAPLAAASGGLGPKIKFDSPVYDFGKVNAGDMVTHTFWFTNIGDQLLTISNVQPSCGCTAAGDWTRQLEPGKAGTIPIQFNSANFSGVVTKMVSVVSNDTNQPLYYLQIKGNIWKPIEVAPNYAVLTVKPDSPGASTSIRVVNHMDEMLYLGAPEINSTNFTVEVRTNMPGKEYQLVVNVSDQLKSGNTQALIKVPTSATNLPPLNITVWANVQPALTVLPTQLTLPGGPMPTRMTPTVTLINNTTNPLSITEPAVSIPGIDFQLREVQPGRYFTIAVTFPQGFELTNKANAMLTVKSSNPNYAEIRVPIVQMPVVTGQPQAATPAPRPAPVAAAPKRILPRQANPTPPPAVPDTPASR